MSRIDDIERRLAVLEARAAENPPAEGPTEDGLWVLNTLTRDLPEGSGVVLFSGVVPVEGEPMTWQYATPAARVAETDWATIAGSFAALGNPVRLTLLQRVLGGIHDAAELARTEGMGTTGQVYHHLRALVAAGWLRVTTRGHYVVPPNRVVPLYTCLVAAGDL